MSTRAKVLTSVMLVILSTCAIFLTLLSKQSQHHRQIIIQSKTDSAVTVANAIIERMSHQYTLRVKSFVNSDATETRRQLIKAFADRDQAQLQKLSKPYFNILQKENPYFSTMGWILPDNTAFLRVHNPKNFGQNVTKMRPDIAAVNKDRRPRSGFTTGYVGLQYRVVQPVYYMGEYIGALQVGINGQVLLDALNQQLKTPAGIAIKNDAYLTIRPEHQKGTIGPTHTVETTNLNLIQDILPDINWSTMKQSVTQGNKTFIVSIVNPLTNYRGDNQGILFVAMDISAEVEKGRNLLLVAFFLSALLVVLSFVILYFSYGFLVQKIFDLNLSLAQNNIELEKRVEERSQELIHEIQERKITEDKLQKAERMEAIGLMAGGVAHDLNNILSGVVSYPELLLMKLPKDSEMRQPITAIYESGLRAAAVVADLLTVARNAAKIREVVQVNTIILDYLASLEGMKLRDLYPGVMIKTKLSPELKNISCSPVHFRKCLMNLVINAAEALADSGMITISAENHHITEKNDVKDLIAGNYVAVSVSDDGPGIATTDLDHIFEPFYTKKKMGRSGTGLGLAVVWNTMQDHNGHVSVESNGQGTTFTLLFPSTSAQKSNAAANLTSIDLQGNGELILVVDDEPHQRDIASQILSLLGYTIKTVSSGEEAISYMNDNKADLLLLDMLMDPGINGRQTYEKIIENHPTQKAVIASGFSESGEAKRTAQLGAGGFIKKPYTLEQLGIAIKKELKGSS